MTARNKWTVTQNTVPMIRISNGLPVSTNIQLTAAVFSITEYMLLKIYVSIIDPDTNVDQSFEFNYKDI